MIAHLLHVLPVWLERLVPRTASDSPLGSHDGFR